MDYTILAGTNSVTPGQLLAIGVTVKALTYPSIGLVGTFIISNIDSIVSADDWPNLKCELWAKTPDTAVATVPILLCTLILPAVPGPVIGSLSDNLPNYINFEIKINGVNCTWPDSTVSPVSLDINFYDSNNVISGNGANPIDLLFGIEKAVSPPVISSFYPDKYVMLVDDQQLNLNWEINDGNDSCTLFDGTTQILQSKAPIPSQASIKPALAGDHAYTLLVTKDGLTAKQSVSVRVLQASNCIRVNNPSIDGVNTPFISNICVASNSSALYSLIQAGSSDTATIYSIGYSNEGFTGKWTSIMLTEADKAALQPFKLSPVIHLKDDNEVSGRLIFIGGSLVTPTLCSNAVAVVNLQKDASKENLVTVTANCAWPSRMGHKCITFPHNNVDKIWIMGGQDEFGAALNDIWVSDNGTGWVNIDGNGNLIGSDPPVPVPWTGRCFFGASAQLDNTEGKQALWVGGGFSETGGTQTPNVWVWDKSSWSQADTETSTTNMFQDSYLSSALASISIDTEDNPNNETGMFTLGGYNKNSDIKSYFNIIMLQTKYYISQGQTLSNLNNINNSNIITLYFKGCIWYLVLTDNGDGGINYSPLYYWVPPVTSYTFK